MGLLTQGDAKAFQSWFNEMVKLRGISVKYMYPVTEELTIYNEIHPGFSEGMDLDIIFEDNPKVQTLKSIGWVSEKPDDKPYIASLPFNTPYLQTKARIFIPPIGQAIPGRWFEVTSIHCNLEYPECYVCVLVPVFEQERKDTDYDQTNFNKIDDNRANQPDEDQPANYPVDANFTFLKNFN